MTRCSAVAAIALLLAVGPAQAHAMLEHAVPGAGATVSAPKEVTLDFSEALEPSFSIVTVTDANGHNVTTGPSQAEGTRMSVPLNQLAPGEYHVGWRALSIDTHRTDGHFVFQVRPR